MFTGIIERTGTIVTVRQEGSNKRFTVQSDISAELKIDQSVAHNGVCLTVVAVTGDTHEVVAIGETLDKSSLGGLAEGSTINLERCMAANGRFDGHIVQGHVDCTGRVESVHDHGGSWRLDFSFPAVHTALVVEKGSVCINGVSLTCFNCGQGTFSVAIIPYTMENTTFRTLGAGDTVNLEFDIIGKYVRRLLGK